MAKFATGKHAFGISDRSGQRYPLHRMRKEWNGLLVGFDEWEAKHPQLDPRRNVVDAQALKDARPDREEPAAEVLLAKDPLVSTLGSSVVTVNEPGHGRSSGDVVRFRNTVGFDGFTKTALEDASGYSITVVDSDRYTVSITGESGESGQRGGGEYASVGPVTVEA